MLRAFPMSLTGAASRWLRNKPSGLIKTWEDFKAKFLISTRQILDSKGVIPTKTTADAKVAIQEMVEYSQKWHNRTSRTRSSKTSDGLAAIQSQLNNLEIEIKKVNEKVYAAQDVNIEQQLRDSTKGIMKILRIKSEDNQCKLIFEPRQATVPFPSRLYDDFRNERKGSYGLKDLDAYSIRTTFHNDSLPIKEKDPRSFTLPCYINNVHFEKSLAALGTSVSVMPLSTYLNQVLDELAHTKLTVDLADRTVKHPKGIAENVLVGIGKFVFLIDFIILDIPEDVNVPLILERPFLSIAHAKVDVFKKKITLRVEDEKIIFKSIKPASSLIKRVYMLSLRERMDLDLEARLMGETLSLSRSLDLLYGDYIELNDLNDPLELKRNRVDDLEPTIKEGEVVNKPMIDIVKARSDFI
ncbi:retrovirus-related pol polyprotein from transposon TNT 1-94 [Tanacetum coccineum]